MNKQRRSLTNCNMNNRPKFNLKSTSSVSLNERFSQILVDQLTQPSSMTYTGLLTHKSTAVNWHNRVSAGARSAPSWIPQQQYQRRRSVWTRIGWRRKCLCVSASRQRGFWSFMNKYRWRIRNVATQRRQRQLRSSWGRDTAMKHSGIKRNPVPTKQQLDAQLDAYMSMSKTRLDQQLEEYMSKSKRRLDDQLDEYMAMAGQTAFWE